MSVFPQNPFGNNHSRNCIACGRDAGLRHWHDMGDLLCWPCWQRVKHVGDSAQARGVVFDACRLFRDGNIEARSGAEIDVLVGLGLITK